MFSASTCRVRPGSPASAPLRRITVRRRGPVVSARLLPRGRGCHELPVVRPVGAARRIRRRSELVAPPTESGGARRRSATSGAGKRTRTSMGSLPPGPRPGVSAVPPLADVVARGERRGNPLGVPPSRWHPSFLSATRRRTWRAAGGPRPGPIRAPRRNGRHPPPASALPGMRTLPRSRPRRSSRCPC